MSYSNLFQNIDTWLISKDNVNLLPKQKWIQAIVLYEVQDYSIFRTEGGEELNTEEILIDNEKISFPVLLGRKLKAAQRRTGHSLLRNYIQDYECSFETTEGGVTGLCKECAECFLRGAAGGEKDYNIQSRVYYSAYYCVEPENIITSLITRNAIDDKVKVTGAALTSNQVVKPFAHFPAIFSLYSVTKEELIYFLKTVNRARRIGARITEGGYLKPYSVALIGYKFELVSPLKLSLYIYKKIKDKITLVSTEEIVKYAQDFVNDIVQKYKSVNVYTLDFLNEAENVNDSELVNDLNSIVKTYLNQVQEVNK